MPVPNRRRMETGMGCVEMRQGATTRPIKKMNAQLMVWINRKAWAGEAATRLTQEPQGRTGCLPILSADSFLPSSKVSPLGEHADS